MIGRLNQIWFWHLRFSASEPSVTTISTLFTSSTNCTFWITMLLLFWKKIFELTEVSPLKPEVGFLLVDSDWGTCGIRRGWWLGSLWISWRRILLRIRTVFGLMSTLTRVVALRFFVYSWNRVRICVWINGDLFQRWNSRNTVFGVFHCHVQFFLSGLSLNFFSS